MMVVAEKSEAVEQNAPIIYLILALACIEDFSQIENNQLVFLMWQYTLYAAFCYSHICSGYCSEQDKTVKFFSWLPKQMKKMC